MVWQIGLENQPLAVPAGGEFHPAVTAKTFLVNRCQRLG